MAVVSLHNENLWTTLRDAGLVEGSAPAADNIESPWYVKTLLAFSGWLAALFLLGFVGVGFTFIIESNIASVLTGSLMIGGAFALLRMQKNEFFEHLALAGSLAGQALIIFAIFKTTNHQEEVAWVLVVLLQSLLAVVIPSFVHRVFSSAVGAYALSMALFSLGAPYMVSGIIMFLAAWCWLNEFRYVQHMRKTRAIGYGLILALIPLKGTMIFGSDAFVLLSGKSLPELWIQPWMGEVLAAAVTLYVIWQLLQRYHQALNSRVAITALVSTLILCGVSFEVWGITVGIVIILLGYAGSNRVLLGLGITSLLFYISSYYYLMDTTLLVKSQTLFIVGLVLFAIRWLILRVIPTAMETGHG